MKEQNNKSHFKQIFQQKNFKKILKKKMEFPVYPEYDGNFY